MQWLDIPPITEKYLKKDFRNIKSKDYNKLVREILNSSKSSNH